jgi:glycosyltransferase involved in cell wall biosynthesis
VISICVPSLNGSMPNFGLPPCDFEVLTCKLSGVGAARDWLVKFSRGSFIVMLDDDISVNSGFWDWILKTERGQFCMVKVGCHLSSRVCAFHVYDYVVNSEGFDASIKYVFEDGVFAQSLIRHGCKLRVVPNRLFQHKEHVNRTGDKRLIPSWIEHSKMFVRYGNGVYPGLVGFFGLRSLLKEPHVFFVKVFGVMYWILKGEKTK